MYFACLNKTKSKKNNTVALFSCHGGWVGGAAVVIRPMPRPTQTIFCLLGDELGIKAVHSSVNTCLGNTSLVFSSFSGNHNDTDVSWTSSSCCLLEMFGNFFNVNRTVLQTTDNYLIHECEFRI